jgi:hypothetical protein
MNRNPYSPPQTNVSPLTAQEEIAAVPLGSRAFYSSNQIFAASLIGAPIAAAWFAAANFRALGQLTNARRVILWGVLATAVVMGLAFVLPDSVPNIVLPLAYSLAIRALAETLFKGVAHNHSSAGPSGSWWRVVGISFLWLLLVLACVVGIGVGLDHLGLLAE